VPEVRRLLLALADRGKARAHRLRWSRWRRAHQARANRCHAARRAHARQSEAPVRLRVPPPLVELTEAEWARLEPLLPPRRPHVGRPRNDHRAVLGGILWVLRNRASWRDMPARFGNYNTAYKRYRLWSDTGLWERLLCALRSGTHQDATDVSL
jgi:transposase